jgi:membrane fusion protein, heavy metal efflux system
MSPRASVLLLCAVAVMSGCRSKAPHSDEAAPHGHDHAPGGHAFTHFTERTELFVELPALVRGEQAPFAVHLTRLSDFKPVAQGRVTVLLGEGEAAERFEVNAPAVAGIFRPVAVPKQTGARRLTIVLEADGAVDRHELGEVPVHATIEEAKRAAPDEEPEASHITYLKEQQWRTEFATAPVAEVPLRAAVIANGVVRARPEGEARVTAPVAGRLVTPGESLPRIGMEVRRDQVLAVIAPRLSGETDFASLELAVSRARIALEHARRERERLEGLLAQSAVPERRVQEARREEQTAQAELTAGQSRLAQYHGTQRAGGSGAQGRVSVRSPLAGSIAQVQVASGAFVEEGRELFHVVDLDRLWLEVQVPESDIGRVRNATGAWFEVEGYERPFEVRAETGGKVVALGGVVDAQTRTVPLLFELSNPGRDLRIGLFARVRVLTGAAVTSPAIPLSALVDDGGQDVAFVQVDGEAFERRPLRLGFRDGDLVQVLEGVAPGERVVTKGAYAVRLAASSSAIPGHGHAH